MRPFSSRNGFEIGFWQGAGDHSMHVKLAYAVSVAAPVAMLAGCSKKSDDGAGRDAAVIAASSASGVRVAGAGRAAPSARRIAQLGRDKENGAGLTIEDINALGLTTGRAAGMQTASRQAAGRRMPDDRGVAGSVPKPLSPLQFDSTKQRTAATDRVVTRSLVRTMDSDAVLTKVGRDCRNALPGDAARNPIRPGALLARRRTGQGTDAGKPDDGRLGMLPHDFKEATNTVLDVVTI
ncbi:MULTISPECIES: amino acid-binding protein [Burkholderia]|uniref:amino acid-binding protein n=1 Tax=Burkholderia TaxID=32008 RepID=UPI0009B82F41|nr:MULTISPECIES: amino acid-binding protein [Burkholderia]MBN3504375.1 amino acid-binding protein [Burkholderia cenocepacia]MBR8267970.1 amino acid-binding protein [Burkholderia cenocepacia]MBR8391308.1 amino acid-binding protein [Burkholderia cenocepacia]MBR8469964.1 amino acid-binding protein [Burkholderia cenocepacia]MBR8491701.1 amino acid-binding protein [Burkholderia cenocepacia]